LRSFHQPDRHAASAEILDSHSTFAAPIGWGRAVGYVILVPPQDESMSEKSLHDVVDAIGVYPIDAYLFVQQGLTQTVRRAHGEAEAEESSDASRHVTGQQLCQGLRDFALERWGLLARTVLSRWNITSTMDFGRIVFALIDHGFMRKTDEDSIDDFRNVFDFKTAFESGYRINFVSASGSEEPRKHVAHGNEGKA
jgi:uncharacterized repeat protein (TIGR04138 family)